MKKLLLGAMVVLLTFSALGCGTKATTNTDNSTAAKKVNGKKGILVASFGTSYPDAMKSCIESTENKVKESFSDYEVRRAFTSNIIIKKLKERDNMDVDTVELALEKMKKDGFSEVIIQPLHIMPGEEYDEVLEMVAKYAKDKSFDKLIVGRPILYREEDYRIAIDALKNQMPELKKDEAVILMGHGSPHPANSSYSQLQFMLQESGYKNVYVGTVEGFPLLDNIIPKLKSDGIKKVTLMPFMLVAGDHANNDMAGDENDSWKSILKKNGFEVEIYLHGLGENKGVQDIYVQHIKDSLDGNPLMEKKE